MENNVPAKRKFFIFRWIDYTSTAGGVIAAACMAVLTVIVTFEVIMRYVFNSPTHWVAETSIFLCMAIGFFGVAYALMSDSHFSVTIVTDRMSPKNRRRLQIFTTAVGLVYSMIFIYKGFEMSRFAYEFGETSSGMMEVPLWIPWLFVPIGGLLLSLQFVNKLADVIMDREAN